ncbi:tyrosine-type recombinase/integrase [Stackebrandtia nassauensis]|uniref:Integrase family protein n=1 Tax=Stackebrandtia nassauensis (strain DSM 44728 / CIP 108903 / NRRL B-16338 / NBRC 102104 / LLR-40K-21) TaxID=446470 RepID=D3Q399_STANL|nr:tyrosine-type recombinase/integrase [Stackebrandtia nassauensis]ADD40069.1 integrase family protein [Stackebrandtia nassauensis DSM 44728]
MTTSNDVRIWAIETRKLKRGNSYRVVWFVAGKRQPPETFTTWAAADSFRSKLVAAHRKGELFDIDTGRPISWLKNENTMSWYELTCKYVQDKWSHVSPSHREYIADTLTDCTEALFKTDHAEQPEQAKLRLALRRWSFSARIRDGGEPPEGHVPALKWLENNTIDVADLGDEKKGGLLVRGVLARLSQTTKGKPAAANSFNNKRRVLNNCLKFAIEIGVLDANPLSLVTWRKAVVESAVDPEVVVNLDQATRLLGAVAEQGELGKRLKAFFGCMYFAALRPEEVIDLRRSNIANLPEEGFGLFRLTNADPSVGTAWTDTGKARQRRQLKHRAVGSNRPVPIHPDLVKLLKKHLDEFGVGRDGRVFVGPENGSAAHGYLRVFKAARKTAFTEAEQDSPLAARPYDLRHACVSTWLAAGVQAPRVAKWAGHSVDVLLKVYAKCIDGQEGVDLERVLHANATAQVDRGGE